MSTLMEDDIKRWTAKRKTALVLDIIQGKTTISEASRAFDLNPSEVEQWVDEGKRGAYSTRWRTRFHADGGRCSSVMADTVPR